MQQLYKSDHYSRSTRSWIASRHPLFNQSAFSRSCSWTRLFSNKRNSINLAVTGFYKGRLVPFHHAVIAGTVLLVDQDNLQRWWLSLSPGCHNDHIILGSAFGNRWEADDTVHTCLVLPLRLHASWPLLLIRRQNRRTVSHSTFFHIQTGVKCLQKVAYWVSGTGFQGCATSRLSGCTRMPHRECSYGRASFDECRDPEPI